MVNCYASGLAMSVNATLALGAAKVFLPVSGTDEIFTTQRRRGRAGRSSRTTAFGAAAKRRSMRVMEFTVYASVIYIADSIYVFRDNIPQGLERDVVPDELITALNVPRGSTPSEMSVTQPPASVQVPCPLLD